MEATEEKLTTSVFASLHGCEAGPDSVNHEAIVKVHYVSPVPVVTNHLIKKH